jgi:hypothetical protein
VYTEEQIYIPDHFIVSKLVMPERCRKNYAQKQRKQETFNVHQIKEESIMNLYTERLNRYLDQRPKSNNINLEWNELKGSIIQVVEEVLG